MKSKRVGLLLITVSAILVVYWAMAGASLWTVTKIPVQVKDDMFGTTSIEWHNGFRPGLELIVPLVLLLAISGAYITRKSRKQA